MPISSFYLGGMGYVTEGVDRFCISMALAAVVARRRYMRLAYVKLLVYVLSYQSHILPS